MSEDQGHDGATAAMGEMVSPASHSSAPVGNSSHAYDLVVEYARHTPTASIPTQFEDLDKWMRGGFHRKALYVLAGRTREGKSSLALSIARRMAIESKARVIYLSLEMTKQEMVERMICQTTLTPIARLEDYRKEGRMEEFVAPVLRMLKSAWLHIEDASGGHIDQLDLLLEEMVDQPADMLVIDHLQHIPLQYGVSRADALSTYMAELKALAKRRNIIILLCSQINRQGHEKPGLIHLKGSGGIEEVADVVMICNRLNYDSQAVGSQEVTECDYEVWVAKHRSGPEYKFMLRFRPACFEFLPPTRYDTPKYASDVPVIDEDTP